MGTNVEEGEMLLQLQPHCFSDACYPLKNPRKYNLIISTNPLECFKSMALFKEAVAAAVVDFPSLWFRFNALNKTTLFPLRSGEMSPSPQLLYISSFG